MLAHLQDGMRQGAAGKDIWHMSDSKQRYSDSSRSYIGNDVPGSMVDQGRYDRSKDREARWNESWKRQAGGTMGGGERRWEQAAGRSQ